MIAEDKRRQEERFAELESGRRRERKDKPSGACAFSPLPQLVGCRQPQPRGGLAARKQEVKKATMPSKLRGKVSRARSEQKENARPRPRPRAAPAPPQKTERKKPYGNQTLSNASLKYRASKANQGAQDMDTASAVYKARMRAKKAAKAKKSS